jgi:hypothetical protein
VFTNESLLHRHSSCKPELKSAGAASFKRLLGCEQNPTQECDSPAHRRRDSPPRRVGLVLETTRREELGATPATVPPERHRSIRHTWLAMLLHLSLVHDGKGRCPDACKSQDAWEKKLVFQLGGRPQPNGLRLSCGATLECSQTQFYCTVPLR